MIVHTSAKTINSLVKSMFINFGREERGKNDQIAITVNWTLVSFSSPVVPTTFLGFSLS